MITETVVLDRAWLSDPADPANNPIAFGSRRPSNTTDNEDGEIRLYSGNVKKAVNYESTLSAIPVTLVLLTPEQFQRLKSWRGMVLLLRTAQGERLFGTFFTMSTNSHLRTTASDDGRAFTVDITFTEVTYSEEV